MYTIKTHRILFYSALVVMLAFGIINLLEYKAKGTTDSNGWIGFAAMAILSVLELTQIRKLKKNKGE